MGATASSLLLAVTAFALYIFRRRHAYHLAARQHQCCPPRKKWSRDVFFGMDFAISMHTDLSMMNRNHDRYGATYQLDSLLAEPVINTIAPENVAVVHGNGKVFGVQPFRLPGMEYFCGKGFLTTDGEMWGQARRMLKPSFAGRNLSHHLDFLSREVGKLLQELPGNEDTVDLQPLLFATFLNSSLYFLFGVDAEAKSGLEPHTAEQFIQDFHAAVWGTGLRVMLGRFKGLAPKTNFVEPCRRAHEYIEHYIEKALEKGDHDRKQAGLGNISKGEVKPRTLVQGLAAQTNDREFIRSQILQGMLAAQETIAVLVSNAVFLLARHPDEWALLRREVLLRGEDLFTTQNLAAFKPVQNILKEVLRIYPVFPVLSRTCCSDTTLPVGGGPAQDLPIYVPKGATVIMSYLTLHMSSKVFGSSPSSFRPARWNSIRPSQWEYMPFGGGERACLGKEKALVEAAYVVARMAQRFRGVESRDERPWKEVVMLTAKNGNGCKVGLIRA